jgi:hypothetical protein
MDTCLWMVFSNRYLLPELSIHRDRYFDNVYKYGSSLSAEESSQWVPLVT